MILPPAFSSRNGNLTLDEIDLIEMTKRYGTPLLVTSENRLRANCRRLIDAFDKYRSENIFKYAVKANSNIKLLSIIADEGFGADASSIPEIEFALESGIKNHDIMFSPNYASEEELGIALKSGVVINLDDIGQFKTMERLRVPKLISFRLNPGFGAGEFNGIVTGGPNAKFGLPVNRIIEAYRTALDSGAKRFGIHMMTGSNVLDYKYFSRMTTKMLDIAGKISNRLKIDFEFVDIGGGFGVPYRPGERPLDINALAKAVSISFAKGCKKHRLGAPKLMMEPGRYIVADTTVLLGRVNNVKRYSKTFVGTDVGMNILIRPALYNAYHDVIVANRINAKNYEKVNVTGEICENSDILAKKRRLIKSKEGDVLAFFNSGAYVYGMSSNYNGRLRPAEILIRKSGKDVLIRRRERIADLFRYFSQNTKLGTY